MDIPLSSRSPWDSAQEVWAGRMADAAAITAAVALAAASFPRWSLAHDERRAALQRLAQVIAASQAEIIDLLVHEAGKTLIDARAEAELLERKITITLDQGLARTPSALPSGDAPGVVWRPRGVAAVLGPFNFPLHLLHGLVVPALAVGATVVAKPSERCPALGALYHRLLAAAGLAGVAQIIQGGATQALALVRQPPIATVAAVGGRPMGLALAAELAARPEVVLALELGGVNQALVLEDADLPAAAAAVADGAWRLAGQRCTATRIVHVPRPLRAVFVEALLRERQRWLPDGTPTGANGALINAAARGAFQAAYGNRVPGLSLLAGDPGRAFGASHCVEPLLLLVEDTGARMHPLYREEHFGPALVVDTYDDLDACVERLGANPHRLAASVFSASRARFLTIAQRLPYGQVNHNRPTAGARSDLPFGGLGHSGNGRPAAVAAGAIFADETVVWPT
jgi:succinylglutamic semialdehyde dehydrogenase